MVTVPVLCTTELNQIDRLFFFSEGICSEIMCEVDKGLNPRFN